MSTPTKAPTIKILSYTQAKSLYNQLQNGVSDYSIASQILGISAGTVGSIVGIAGSVYLNAVFLNFKAAFVKMDSNDELKVTTTWRYVNHGKNSGFVANQPTYSVIKH